MQIPVSIESALATHFKQTVSPSLPGVSWLVRLEYGGHRRCAA